MLLPVKELTTPADHACGVRRVLVELDAFTHVELQVMCLKDEATLMHEAPSMRLSNAVINNQDLASALVQVVIQSCAKSGTSL